MILDFLSSHLLVNCQDIDDVVRVVPPVSFTCFEPTKCLSCLHKHFSTQTLTLATIRRSSTLICTDLALYTMPPPNKKRKLKTSAVEEVTFDYGARQDYLTGFHKRKVERQKIRQDLAKKRAREERIEERKKVGCIYVFVMR